MAWTITLNTIMEMDGDLDIACTLIDLGRENKEYPWRHRYPRADVGPLSDAALRARVFEDTGNHAKELDSASARIDHLKTNYEGNTYPLPLPE